MKSIHIEDSYNIWRTNRMRVEISQACLIKYGSLRVTKVLNRSYRSMYIEWWLHNIAYWLTLPFVNIPTIAFCNERARSVDLEEWGK